MRSLSSTLLAAQKSSSREPYVKVEVLNKLASVARPKMDRLYTGTESDFYHAATMPEDGSLIRARVQPTANDLYIQRVVSPGSGSDFTLWTFLNKVSSGAGIEVCSRGAIVLLFYVDNTDNVTIYFRESANYGATWSTPSVVITPSVTAVKWLAAGIRPNGDVALFYASDNHVVYSIKRTGGAWGLPSSWSNSVSTITGMACVYQGDWNLSLSGRDSFNDFKVWTCIYGNGGAQAANTWSPLMELTTASGSSLVEFHVPFMSQPDSYRIFFVEKYTGSLTYSRPNWSHSLASATFANNLWREPVPFDLTSSYGVAIAHGNGYLWLYTPYGVWRGQLTQTTLDLSDDVLSLTIDEKEDAGQATIALRNDDGRYGGVETGSLPPIEKGSEVRVSPGYVSSSGKEVSLGPAFWIQGWEYVSKGAEGALIIYADNAWSLLDHWRARRQYTWTSGDKSVLDIMKFVAARVGLDITTLSASGTLTTHKPAFTVNPQEKGTSALRRLLAMVPDVLFFRGSTGYVRNPQSTDVTDYAYGTDHAIEEGNYVSEAQEFNRVQAYGGSVIAEAFSWVEIAQVYDRLLQIHDLNLDTTTKAQDRSNAALRKQAIAAASGQIRVPTNCGQELYDVIEITDGRAGLNAARRRVRGIYLEYGRYTRPRYHQIIGLGGV